MRREEVLMGAIKEMNERKKRGMEKRKNTYNEEKKVDGVGREKV